MSVQSASVLVFSHVFNCSYFFFRLRHGCEESLQAARAPAESHTGEGDRLPDVRGTLLQFHPLHRPHQSTTDRRSV